MRLSQAEYESIFDNAPSFQEKKAFIDVFRKKWKEDKGYCSLFDKRNAFKQAVLNSISKDAGQRPMTSQGLHSRLPLHDSVSADRISINGYSAKFHNPIQNSEGPNIDMFIESLYARPSVSDKFIQSPAKR